MKLKQIAQHCLCTWMPIGRIFKMKIFLQNSSMSYFFLVITFVCWHAFLELYPIFNPLAHCKYTAAKFGWDYEQPHNEWLEIDQSIFHNCNCVKRSSRHCTLEMNYGVESNVSNVVAVDSSWKKFKMRLFLFFWKKSTTNYYILLKWQWSCFTSVETVVFTECK